MEAFRQLPAFPQQDDSPPGAPQMQQHASPSMDDSPPGSCLSQTPSRMMCSSPPALISTAALLPTSPPGELIGMDLSPQLLRQGFSSDAAPSGHTAAAGLQPLRAADLSSSDGGDDDAAAAGGGTDDRMRRPADSAPAAVLDDAGIGSGSALRSFACLRASTRGGPPGMPQLPLSAPAGITECDTSKDSSDTPTGRGGGRFGRNADPDTPDTPSSEELLCL